MKEARSLGTIGSGQMDLVRSNLSLNIRAKNENATSSFVWSMKYEVRSLALVFIRLSGMTVPWPSTVGGSTARKTIGPLLYGASSSFQRHLLCDSD